MADLRDLAAADLGGAATWAALYRPAAAVRDDPIRGVPLWGIPGLALAGILVFARWQRRAWSGHPSRPNSLKPTARVLVAVSQDRVALLVVKSRPWGWIRRRTLTVVPIDQMSRRPLDGVPFGFELSWPPAGYLRLRPLYGTEDGREIYRCLLTGL